jgi:hypothetical protein
VGIVSNITKYWTQGQLNILTSCVYMLLYTPDFVRVGFSYLGCRRFNEGDQAQAQ